MARKKGENINDLLPRLKADVEKTVAAYDRAAGLRARKMQQDLEQIRVYIDILEKRGNGLKLSGRKLKKLQKLLSQEISENKKDITHRKQQDRLEDRFLELQKALVGLLSKQFDY